MSIIKGYGISVRNSPVDIKKTVSYQELTTIGISESDICIDVVRSDSASRPELDKLIETLNVGDRIDLYSIDTLLQGNKQVGTDYYEKIISKGIDLLIYDFGGAIARLSPFSTLRFGNTDDGEDFLTKGKSSPAELIEQFTEYASSAEAQKNTGGMKTEERLSFSQAFKDIYFAYESYQIDQATTLELLSKYCGIENKITFWLMAQDYERSLEYVNDLQEYASHTPEILSRPKRCGGLPSDYQQILDYAEENLWHIKREDQRIEGAMLEQNYIAGYEVFKRWELLAEKKPKPRKPVSLGFNVKDFENTHK